MRAEIRDGYAWYRAAKVMKVEKTAQAMSTFLWTQLMLLFLTPHSGAISKLQCHCCQHQGKTHQTALNIEIAARESVVKPQQIRGVMLAE